MLLHCISPIGKVGYQYNSTIKKLNDLSRKVNFGKICSVDDDKFASYDLSIESDILFHPSSTQFEEVLDLLERTLVSADNLENILLGIDKPSEEFLSSLFLEAGSAED